MASVEGLLSEVSPNVKLTHVINAGDQLYYGDRRLYTHVEPKVQAGKQDKTQEKPTKHEEEGNPVYEAIQTAKHAVQSVLGGIAHALEPANDEVEELRKEIAALKLGQGKLRDEITELRQLVQKLIRSYLYHTLKVDNSILILGDGNLSFSLSLANILPNSRITATVLESEQEFLTRYPSGERNLHRLRTKPNVEIMFNFDATRINPCWRSRFTDIFMNFPHPGGKTNLKKNKDLLLRIFKSVSGIMDTERPMRFRLSLAKGQSGLDFDNVRNGICLNRTTPKHNPDSWQAIYLAAECYLKVERVDVFVPEMFQGYQSSGYLKRDQQFHNSNGSETIVFISSPHENCLDTLVKLETKREKPGLFHAFRPLFTHDISILFKEPNITIWKTFLFSLVGKLAGNLIVSITEVEILRSTCPKTNLPNRIYRLIWQCVEVPLTKKLCNELQEVLRSKFVKEFEEENLPFILT